MLFLNKIQLFTLSVEPALQLPNQYALYELVEQFSIIDHAF